MAEQILSQNEVDALLKGVSGGEIKVSEKKAEPESVDGVEKYDFTSHTRVVRARMPAFEMVNEKFCRQTRSSASTLINKVIDITSEPPQMMKFGDFLKNLPLPSSMNIFQMPPLRGNGILALDPNLVFQIVGSYFGGDNRFATRVEGKDFTPLEQMVIKKVVDLIFAEFTKVWKPVYPVQFEYLRTETNPQFANIMNPTEVVSLVTFAMEIDGKTNNFYLCIPYYTIEPIKEKLYGTQAELIETSSEWVARLKNHVMGIELGITCVVGSAEISVSEVMGLQVGDVIELDRKVTEPLDVCIECVPKFHGKPGLAGKNYAVEILGAVKRGGKND